MKRIVVNRAIDKSRDIVYNVGREKQNRRNRDVKPVSRGRDGDLKPIPRVE